MHSVLLSAALLPGKPIQLFDQMKALVLLNKRDSPFLFYSFHEGWTRDISESGNSGENDLQRKLTKPSSSVIGQQLVVPGHNSSVHTISTIHVAEVYGHEKEMHGTLASHIPV